MSREGEAIDRVLAHLPYLNYFPLSEGRGLTIVCLVREADWRPLNAPWWKKQKSHVIAVELYGNFFVRHSDGSVGYWDHSTQTDTTIAPSVREFCANLVGAPWPEEAWKTEHRAKVNAFFRTMAREHQITLNPDWDFRTLTMTGRSFEETKGHRQFFITADEQKGIDAYTKKTGLDYEVTLLQIIVDPEGSYFPMLWGAYVKWIHQGAEESEVFSYLTP